MMEERSRRDCCHYVPKSGRTVRCVVLERPNGVLNQQRISASFNVFLAGGTVETYLDLMRHILADGDPEG